MVDNLLSKMYIEGALESKSHNIALIIHTLKSCDRQPEFATWYIFAQLAHSY